jgi:2-keto-4-pentenoate hydratase
MRTGRPIAKIKLSAEVAGIPEGYTQQRKTARALALGARIVLGAAAGLSNKAVAALRDPRDPRLDLVKRISDSGH